MRQVSDGVTLEGLVRFGQHGRPMAWLAQSWTPSPDHLQWTIRLRPGVTFHDGTPVTASTVAQSLRAQLPGRLGPPFADVSSIDAVSPDKVQVSLKQPSAFLIEALDAPIREPGNPSMGTGPFFVAPAEGNTIELRANDKYYGGRPLIDRVNFVPYASTRAAWADLLRDKIDMLYEVGLDAFDSLQLSTQVSIVRLQQPYQNLLLLNLERPQLKSRAVRQALSAAVDRARLVREGLDGHGTPATGPVWPDHWAYDAAASQIEYNPTRIAPPDKAITLTCIFGADASRERLALALQQQLQMVGVNLQLEALNPNEVVEKMTSGDFDAILSDFVQGPNLVRPYLFWHTGGPFNYGHYSSAAVDKALDAVRHSTDDDEYKAGVAAFQRAITDDPPAIFLAWGERIRAVSKRFEVPDTGEVWGPYLRLWRPASGYSDAQTTH